MSAAATKASFEDYLVGEGLISPVDREKIDKLRKETGVGLYPAVRRAGNIAPDAFVRAVSNFLEIPILGQDQWQAQPEILDRINVAFLRENNVYPIDETDDGVLVAMEDPSDVQTLHALKLALQRPIIPRVAAAEDIQSAIERASRERDEPGALLEIQGREVSSDDIEYLRDIALGAPVVRFVNHLIQDAVHARATDIHIEPFEGRLSVRMRVDGLLQTVSPPPAHMSKAIVSRIKILSGLNIAERRLPQDGRARVRISDRRLDLRVATAPTTHGEAVAIRLLDNVRRVLDFGRLGFNERDEAVLRSHLTAPYGLILVTGPTGSGKTTTLATALSILNEGHRKILTIEDPIEYELDGVNQTQAKPAIGLTFASALRSFLRHDPDVLMVGEMRDGETAGIGIHAALTGHLVLSTLHTNTAAGAIPRLLDMGVDAFLLASSLRCVVGQRLVRVLCPHCKKLSDEPVADDATVALNTPLLENREAVDTRWRAVGCNRCYGTGYTDRMVISEVLDVDKEICDLIRPDVHPSEIEKVACRKGMTTMVADGLRKSQAGYTTLEEVRRVALHIQD